MNEAEKIHSKVLAMLDGEPWMKLDAGGEYAATVAVNPDNKMWGVIDGGRDALHEIRRMRAVPLTGDVVPIGGLAKLTGRPMAYLCRTEAARESLAADIRKQEKAQFDRLLRGDFLNEAIDRILPKTSHALVAGYTIDECRSGIQHSHPDKGGDPNLFELWKARLEYAKSQEASNQP